MAWNNIKTNFQIKWNCEHLKYQCLLTKIVLNVNFLSTDCHFLNKIWLIENQRRENVWKYSPLASCCFMMNAALILHDTKWWSSWLFQTWTNLFLVSFYVIYLKQDQTWRFICSPSSHVSCNQKKAHKSEWQYVSWMQGMGTSGIPAPAGSPGPCSTRVRQMEHHPTLGSWNNIWHLESVPPGRDEAKQA